MLDIPGPADIVMFALSVWSPSVVYVDGMCPAAERFFPFIEWYSNKTPFSSGELTRLQFLSSELVAASRDSAVQRRFESDGYFPLKSTDHQLEPRQGRPFPGPGPATDRWFSFRNFYYSGPAVATRRLFLEQRAAEAAMWLQCWAYGTWEAMYRCVTLLLALFVVVIRVRVASMVLCVFDSFWTCR